MAYYYGEDYLNDYIGCGVSSKNTFDDYGSTNVARGFEKIRDSILSILSTRIGERFMLPEFGSKLHSLVFEPNTPEFADLADFYIRDAVSKWEKRVSIVNVNVNLNEGNVVPIEITYRINDSNLQDTFVYPFSVSSSGEPLIYAQGTYTQD